MSAHKHCLCRFLSFSALSFLLSSNAAFACANKYIFNVTPDSYFAFVWINSFEIFKRKTTPLIVLAYHLLLAHALFVAYPSLLFQHMVLDLRFKNFLDQCVFGCVSERALFKSRMLCVSLRVLSMKTCVFFWYSESSSYHANTIDAAPHLPSPYARAPFLTLPILLACDLRCSHRAYMH